MNRTGAGRRIGSACSRLVTVGAALAVALGITSSHAGLAARGAQQDDDKGIAPSARAQIESLLREKESRSPAEQKIDSRLLYAWRMQQGLPVAPGVQSLDVEIPYADDGHVIVDVSAKQLSPNLLSQLHGYSREVKETGPASVQVHVDLSQVERIAAEPDVIFVQPRQGAFTSRVGPAPSRDWTVPRASRRAAALAGVLQSVAARQEPGAGPRWDTGTAAFPPEMTTNAIGTGAGVVTSQADITHRTALFRALTGFNGTGVKIGVLSDGVAHLAAAQATGDLGAVTVLPGQTGAGDEGTAMLELIHDIAPGAQLYFATAFTSILSFAQNIRDLRAAGCDIIVDDAGYFVESPFQDGQGPGVMSSTNGGVVTQAVNDVTSTGALYFSAAGNSGNLNDGTSGVWEGDFVAGAATVNPPIASAGTFHRFFATQDFDTLTALGGGTINLYWSDPLGGSGNDYDIFALNSAGTAVAAASTNLQTGSQDPFEQMSADLSSPRIVIVKKTGAAARFLHLNTNRGRLSTATAGQIHGHAGASSIYSFAVAAVNAGVSYPNPFSTSNVVETFSSDGPRRSFYLGDGTPLTPGNLLATGGVSLAKPDIAAADGVAVTGAGDFATSFFGTSAAAPNAAAIMALFKSQNPGFTQLQLRNLLLSTALDIEAPGPDRDSGAGIVMAAAPQPGCTFTMNPPGPVSIPGGNTTVTVNASTGTCSWVAWSSVPWISMAGSGAGVGNGSLGIRVAANHGAARSGNIVIQGGSIATVTQLGTPPASFGFTGSVAIPDLNTVEVPLDVSGVARRITKVTVSLYLTHTYDSDLTISLVGPDGTTVALSANRGSSGDNYGTACTPTTSRTTFDDSVANAIAVGTAPFVGSFRPEQPLAAFNNRPANGTWKLRITDGAHLDVGTLLCFSLNVNQGPPFGSASDFNGDGAADLAVFRPSNGLWFVNGVGVGGLGQAGDVPVPGDYNGDGAAEVMVYRPSTGQWFFNGGSPASLVYGQPGDVPVPADYDGDERTDIAVFRTIGGAGVWYVNLPAQPPVSFGNRGDVPMPGDYDGDGKADLAVFRPSTGQWFIATAASGFTTITTTTFGAPGDVPVRGDFDSDRKLDFVVFRPSTGTWFVSLTSLGLDSVAFGQAGDIPAGLDMDGDGILEFCLWRPSTGQWFIGNRITASTSTVPFGQPGDIPVGARPQLPSVAASDFDADGASDITVVRPSSATWFTSFSATGFATSATTPFGVSSDVPVNGDYDGDRRTDIAVYRPSTGQWFIARSATGTTIVPVWGLPGDVPMPADYDGDGRTDLAVFRPSTGQWFVQYSSTGGTSTSSWGVSTDQPFARDFDGDGRADLAVYRPSTGQWFLQLSTTTFGTTITRVWGLAGDIPVPGDFDGDGRSEIAVFRPSTGQWLGIDALTGGLVLNVAFGLSTDILVPHDYDGDGRTDAAVFRPSAGQWFVRKSSSGATLTVTWGASGDTPR